MNIETSLSFFPIFDTATPSLISIMIYLCIKRFQIGPSNIILFFLGITHDILFGSNLGVSSVFFLLMKYLSEHISLDFINKKNDEDWIFFTLVFLISFFITFLINILINLNIPDLSPILFHVGITLIIFPFINLSIDFVYFITKLIKN